MSVHAYAWAWQQPCTDSDKLVLLAMCEFADSTGLCWPSITTLSRMVGRHRTTVIRSIDNLVHHGFVLRAIGRGRSNTYRLALTEPRFAQVPRGARVVAPCDGLVIPGLSTPVAPCDQSDTANQSHGATTVRHHPSHSYATGVVAQLCDMNSNEPSGTVSDDDQPPAARFIPERDRQRATERIAAIRAELERTQP